MAFYVYIIQSQANGSFYKGFSQHPALRIMQHNNGETQSTKHLIPWTLIYVEQCDSKTEALIREKNLKKATRQRLLALINHPKNIAAQFF